MKILILFFAFLVLGGCSTMHIMKECVATDADGIYVCRNMKPWE